MFPPEMVTFTTGDTTQTVTVSAVDDMAIENTETFTLMLSTASMDVTFPQPSVEVSIIDWTTESRSSSLILALCKPPSSS